MLDAKYLLTDEQMSQFITKGYVVLRNELPDELHRSVMNKITRVFQEEGNPGNNILPRIPEIQHFFDTPIVKGALTSILGPDYYMHPHRHCHYNSPGNQTPGGGQWHKDGYWSSMRSHRPWWAMIFYYTQDITEELGPTAIMPGTQYYEKFIGDKGETLLPTGKAGTMVLVHFDIWHKATLNLSGLDRFMLKFQFVRLKAPEYASWNHRNPELSIPDGLPARHTDLWQDVWDWLRGKRQSMPDIGRESHEHRASDDLGDLLRGSSEIEALNAAYALGRMGAEGIGILIDCINNGTNQTAERAAYGLQAAGAEAAYELTRILNRHPNEKRRGLAAFVLGMIVGPDAYEAVPALTACLREDGSEWVRRNAVEALGMIGKPSEQVVPAIADALAQSLASESDDAPKPNDMYVNQQQYIINKIGYTAALALLRTGKSVDAGQVLSVLEKALNSKDRYARAYASEALTNIRTEEAIELLIRHYRTSRWCPDTNKASTF
ncbi:HEAT repeat domain-containing protein [Paenibacillus thermotolerans]|uniref:HEAT repeat domain-containing protein n=1 Tax=Paenibacillus thermotolerans TaxID=3027807 RepID=UPI0023689283|nr:MULTISPECIES: HEAT repeat domain-containing protein [unclassified Paenibacillus]